VYLVIPILVVLMVVIVSTQPTKKEETAVSLMELLEDEVVAVLVFPVGQQLAGP